MTNLETMNFTITKRDGSAERFSLDKIMNAIVKAFGSVGTHRIDRDQAAEQLR